MDATRVASVLRSGVLKQLDGDLLEYVSGMIADGEAAESVGSLVDMVGPFLESSGLCADDTAVSAMCKQIYSSLVAAKLVKPRGKNDVISKLIGEEVVEAEEKPSLLRAPVKLGATAAVDTASLDFMWGKDTNAFLNQNSVLDYEENAKEVSKAAKRTAREQKKDESRAKFEKARTDAEVAASGPDMAVSSGSVTYALTSSRKAQDINITGVTIAYGAEVLLDNAELQLIMGRHAGLVGRNGSGKSTLLRHMARHDIHGAGSQRFPDNIRVLHVEQEIAGDDRSVLDTVLAADVERLQLLGEETDLLAALDGVENQAENGVAAKTAASASSTTASVGARIPVDLTADAIHERLKEVTSKLHHIDAYSAESRASAILHGLQFTSDMQSWPTKALSGGWRMRVALACALFVEPDILLLDEPTNHLDVPAVVWLENYLIDYKNTLVVVSHDRRFLNAVSTDVIHLHSKQLEYYRGNYDTFERTRSERARHHAKAVESQALKREHMQAFIDKFRYNAKRAALVQSRIKAMERMAVLEEVADDPRWKFEFPDPGTLGMPVMQVLDVAFGYKHDKPLFRDVSFGVDLESRIAIVGPNGAGKSTLLKLMLGELSPQAGHVVRNAKLRIACFTQHHVAQLDLSASPLDYIMRLFPGHKPEAMRSHLGSFGLSGDLALQRIGTLSGGQKSRVAFAIMSWKKPHILILDEPTNHLDIETIDAVIVALGNFQGGVIIVSHDQHFIESVADEIWVVGEGKVKKFKGEFKDYRKVALGEKASLDE